MIIELLILIILLFIILLFVLAGIRYRKTIQLLTYSNTELDKEVKSLKYNYNNILKIYKKTLNKIKILQKDIKRGVK
jgi:hypothetical protein